MLKQNDGVVLQELRKNSRKQITEISKSTKIPVSTVFDILKRLESDKITKHVSLLDYSKLGFSLPINFLIATKSKNDLLNHLLSHPNINSVYRISSPFDFYIEGIFRDMKELTAFKENIMDFGIKKIEEHCVVEQIKKEEFFPKL